MKKLILLLLVIILVFTSACSHIKIDDKSLNKTQEKLLSVLNNETKFITGKGEKVYLKDYNPFYVFANDSFEKDGQFIPNKYTFVDMDMDGTAELIVEGAPELYDNLILRLDNNKIYGYSLESRWFQSLKQDGSYRAVSSSYASDYRTMSFDKEKYTEKIFAECIVYDNGIGDIHSESTIDSKAVSYEEIKQFVDEWNNRPNAEWTYFTESPLLPRLIGSSDVALIDNFKITHGYSAIATSITDKSDFKFLEKYTYSHLYPSDQLHKLFLFPENAIIELNSGNINVWQLYLMKDGSIAVMRQVVNNGVTETKYDVYTADKEYSLDEDALIKLLKKYDGYNEALAESYKAYPEYSVNDNVCIKDGFGKILLNSDCFDTVQVRNVDNMPSVLLTLTDEGKDLFATVTAEHIGETLDLCVGDEVISSPTVMDKITDGKVSVTVESIEKAQAIVDKLKK